MDNSVPCQLFYFLGTEVEKFDLRCYGDFVENESSNVPSKYVLFGVFENYKQVETVIKMFNCECSIYYSNLGVEVASAKNSSLYYLAIGVNANHLTNLNMLRNLVAADWTISPEKIKEARALTVSAVKTTKA